MDKVAFDELEHQYRALKKLFKQEWRKVKKDIRQNIVWSLFKKGASDDGVAESEQGLAQQDYQETEMPQSSQDDNVAVENPTGQDE